MIFHRVECLHDHCTRAQVVTSAVVLSVIAVVLGQFDWSDNIEIEDKRSVALCLEVVFHAAFISVLRIVFGIGNIVEKGLIVSCFKTLIGVFHEYDETFLIARESSCFFRTAAQFVLSGCCPLGSFHLCLFLQLLFGGFLIVVRLSYFHIALPVGCLPPVSMLIAFELCFDFRSVCQTYRFPLSWFHGYCM